ncbi:pimeloyl-ACP methyl ester carboxylesterase [Bradyrhizobium sp. CIR48]|uniref:alpha/beta fold hydrolase n=1 Tax=Bradyrhizobium sp. CIR48 TaxID=2663840 RepID=UPI001605A19B|nr:alpha/beta fold hydrolase [Bradyrhizobium sp. CIR48]MBB4428321.1 pimeloyl-ACP methyl ester carboxylesterase [Bradyrhizobium sp. CIR48]
MGIDLAEISSFYVGGRVATVSGRATRNVILPQHPVPYLVDPNGDFDVGQIYVQAFKLARPKHAVPLLLWHGGGLTGAVWETQADGGPGWLSHFLRAGLDVYVTDAVGAGRASWAHQPELFPSEPLFRSKRECWEHFRIGPVGSYDTDPKKRLTFEGTQFPDDKFDQFTKMITPRWEGVEEASAEAYCALVASIGCCIIVAHSSAAAFAYEAVRRMPDFVRALCLVEPSAPPAWPISTSIQVFQERRLLLLFGDFFEHSSCWRTLRSQMQNWARQVDRVSLLEWMDLPQRGIVGNSHCPMADRNSESIATLVIDWLVQSCGRA